MTDAEDPRPPDPLPTDWLPEAQLPDRAPEWDARTRRIMAAADARLRSLGETRSAAGPATRVGVGRWWRPAAALAGVAIAMLLLTDRPTPTPQPPRGSLPLSLVAAEGDPATLWESFGIRADPVLALIALESRSPR